MNDDRISELYKGEIWTDALQQRAQRRIHWLCAQAKGSVVLDIGCSQGIASILLGREGFTVTGIDIQPSRIEYALADLADEPEDVRDRVRFEIANGSELAFPDDHFDTVILGEVIEHLSVPGRLLEEVRRVLKPNGALAITTPFGLSPHHDHKQTFYPFRLWTILSDSFIVRSVDVVDRYFRIVCERPEGLLPGADLVDEATIEKLDGVFAELDLDLQANRLSVASREKELSQRVASHEKELSQARAEARTQTSLVSEKTSVANQLQQRLAKVENELKRAEESQANAISKISALDDRLAARETHIANQAKKIAHLGTAHSTASNRVNEQRRRIRRLEADRAKLRDRLALTRWKLASTTARKWWRIGAAIGAVKSRPWRIFVLPFDVVSIVFSQSNLPPRPKPTPVASPASEDSGPSTVGTVDMTASEMGQQALDSDTSKPMPMVVTAPAAMSLAPPPVTAAKELRVASILDEMSHQSFAPECHLITFGPHNWLEVLERERPNMLLVESAWRGNSGSWEYKVGSYAYPESVDLPDLTAVVQWCRQRGIPTVFWNKEDPVHFEKFKEAASLFDVVFTTDQDMIDRYEALPGRIDRVVGVLPFAAQPTIHNPVGAIADRDSRPVFAGAYYRNRHQSRQSQLDMLLDAAMPFGLMIYDRMGGAVSDSFGFPDRFQSSIEGTLPYDEMVEAYRSHRVFLNVNSVSESPTMFSRRIFELLASGTPVVSTPSIGVERMFGGVVEIVETQAQAHEAIARLVNDEDWWRDRSVRGVESVFRGNTYQDRLHTIVSMAGLAIESAEPSVSLVLGPNSNVSTRDLAETDELVEILVSSSHQLEGTSDFRVPVREVDLPSTNGSPDIARSAARVASGDWLAFAESPQDLRALGSLMAATRIAPAEIYVPAPTWSQGHTFASGVDGANASLASAQFVRRFSWSPWRPSATDVSGARIYRVPIIDD